MNSKEYEHNKDLAGLLKRLCDHFEVAARKPEEIILTEDKVREILNISGRTWKYLKARRQIAFSKIGGRTYVLLSDLLDFVKTYRKEVAKN